MAGGEVIGAAIGVLLLILVGYVLVGSTLTTADVVATAQKDITLLQEERLGTAVDITRSEYHVSSPPVKTMEFRIQNTGNRVINYTKMQVFATWSTSAPVFFKNGNGYSGTWYCEQITPDNINPGYLDPDEVLFGWIYDGMDIQPVEFGVITQNGIIDQTTDIT